MRSEWRRQRGHRIVARRHSGDVKFTIENFDWGSDYYKKHGVMMPCDGLERLKNSMQSISAPSERRMFLTTLPYGGSDRRFARASTNMPTSGRQRSFRALLLHCAIVASAISTG